MAGEGSGDSRGDLSLLVQKSQLHAFWAVSSVPGALFAHFPRVLLDAQSTTHLNGLRAACLPACPAVSFIGEGGREETAAALFGLYVVPPPPCHPPSTPFCLFGLSGGGVGRLTLSAGWVKGRERGRAGWFMAKDIH